MKLLLYVQHLLGIGHARRAALLARALAEDGVAVTVAAGGPPVPGIDFAGATVVQLPPARARDAAFSAIVDAEGRPVDAAWKKRRTADLLALNAELRPEALLIESFPFGRWQFRFELEPLLEIAARARPRPLIASSVRDILVTGRDPAKVRAMAAAARRWFDLVLVHGDPAVVPFGDSFPAADEIADLIRYTGYVGRPPAAAAAEDAGTDGAGEVVVSVGGGAVGERLLRTALAARPLGPLAEAPWRLLAGPDLPETVFAELVQQAPPGVTVERARPDFPALLRRCAASISQAGYNTVMDLLAAGCPAVLVPFAGPGQTEQTDRARLLTRRSRASMVEEDALTPAALAAALAAAVTAPAAGRYAPPIALDGAATTARLIREAAEARGLCVSSLSSAEKPV